MIKGADNLKSIFSSNIEIDKTAILNWRTKRHEPIYNMIVLAEGYMSSALILCEQLLKDKQDKRDSVIFPILFNLNHGIELYLKSIIWSLNLLNKNTNKEKLNNHNIMAYFKTAKSLAITYENTEEKVKTINELFGQLESYLNELESYIVENSGKTRIDFPRYVLDYKNELPQFYILSSKNVSIDIKNLLERFIVIDTNLNRLAEHYYYEYSEQ